ncbi:exo-alpha-sialidase [Paenibacillus allorhizosphaerae]|uniref:Sialidase domain-containing protein n=1 Tax=Paenibacillus allorhizosphaerae TaxID=2849866 RepID=A0ABM8VDB0_9BACL|nr:exo-alpha-sialidase [Paenibacillus allorhizosphaerae]CAG7627012.1 hypothetical protein PAECIP111802_01309 [Paenibacillus allorhizosphaerae]
MKGRTLSCVIILSVLTFIIGSVMPAAAVQKEGVETTNDLLYEAWDRMDGWSKSSGKATIETTAEGWLRLYDRDNSSTSLTKKQITVPGTYTLEYRARIGRFSPYGFDTLGIQVTDGRFRLFLSYRDGKLYANTQTGASKVFAKVIDSIDTEWHDWQISVDNGKAGIFMDGIFQADFEMETSDTEGRLVLWVKGQSDVPAESYLDYIRLSQGTLAGSGSSNRLRDLQIQAVSERFVTGPGNMQSNLLQLNDGSLLMTWVNTGKGIATYFAKSFDQGETFTQPQLFHEWTVSSVLQLASGNLLALLRNEPRGKFGGSTYSVIASADYGATWSQPNSVMAEGSSFVMNDRLIQLSNGRLLLPVGYLDEQFYEEGLEDKSWIGVYYSDDEGRTWNRTEWITGTDAAEAAVRNNLQEPQAVQLADGQVKIYARTSAGYIYEVTSDDEGRTWHDLKPTAFQSPLAPFSVKRDPYTNNVYMVWDNSPPSGASRVLPRWPLSMAVSADSAKTWKTVTNLEEKEGNYGYPQLLFMKDRIIVSYYHTNQYNWTNQLVSVKSVTFDRGYLEAGGAKSIDLTPKFSPDQRDYTAVVPPELKTVFIKPVTGASAKAELILNGTRIEAGADFIPITLQAGRNDIRIQVFSSEGEQRDYDLQITRSSPVFSSILSGLSNTRASTPNLRKRKP